MNVDEVRERFLKFFEKRGHTIYPSDKLVPENDPSLLFTGAGMNQFKDMFLGRGRLPFKRATTSQKCLRTGDIERVGTTIGHHTFFEMLGNFSFGDYFKEDAINWAWEFLTRELNTPEDRLFISVYKDDKEAFDVWKNKISEKKIYKFGEHDNFWPADAPSQGPNGPCGPCSEIFYDFGEKYGCAKPTCGVSCNCGRFVEVWNLVFTQFDRQDDGTLAPLPQKNIDTGMGLERLCAVMQGVRSNFDTDIFQPIIAKICEILKYNNPTDHKVRRIADHIRAVVFCIADGVIPSNEGRGYVVRKLIRTALRDGFFIGTQDTFLYKLVDKITEIMEGQYPELQQRKNNTSHIIEVEEKKFMDVLLRGEYILVKHIEKLKGEGKDTIPGDITFIMHDTYGYSLEMTETFSRGSGMKGVDKVAFENELEKQKSASRSKTKLSGDIFGKGALAEIKTKFKHTQFLGYKTTLASGKVLAIIKGDKLVKEAREGDEVLILMNKTPFYGESGGQIGDTGFLTGKNLKVEIKDTTKPDDYFLHSAKVLKGVLKVGATVKAEVDAARRLNIMRNHTATHILQSALRNVVGKHIEQAGSLVAPDRLRFDFTHYQALTKDEIRRIEDFVNEKIMSDIGVTKKKMSMAQAKKRGALMFFGEKYGKRVRVVSVGDFSTELCGGTHLNRTNIIGGFKIISETSIASGTRRIEAITGPAVLATLRELDDRLEQIAEVLSAPKNQVVQKAKSLLEEVKTAKQDIARARKLSSEDHIGKLLKDAKTIGNEKVVLAKLDATKPDELRSMVDILIKKNKVASAILVSQNDGRQTFVIGVRDDIAKGGVRAGEIARTIGKLCGGGGGGRDVIAEAGGNDTSKTDSALAEFENYLKKSIEK